MARKISTATSRRIRSVPIEEWGISPDERQRVIFDAAYDRYVQRGYAHGHDLEDWLAAEANFALVGRRRKPRESGAIEELGMQHSGALGPGRDDALKRVTRQHPLRDIPRVESMEPVDAPPKE